MEILLTKREKEVVVGICEGLSNIEIGDRLYISKHTVKSIVETIYAKTSCHSRVNLTVWAIKHGVYKI